MRRTKISELSALGQSIWLDYISRSLIEKGRLKELIDMGLRGMTSNPTIFDKAISSGNDYDGRILELCKSTKEPFEIYDDLTIEDIRDACGLFAPVWGETKGLDGYVSLEINPKLAFDAKESIEEGKRLHRKVNRPNLMLKVPSTKEGFEAVEELTALGINVNVTLIFSVEQHARTAQAYVRGIKRLLQNNGDISKVRSVASVFVSRIDTAGDKLLDKRRDAEKDMRIITNLNSLKGKAAVANCALIYKQYLDIFSYDEYGKLKDKGMNPQRVLWGSTSTKNPTYSDIKYITELIGKDTVNTVPEATLEAFLDHGVVKEALPGDVRGAQAVVEDLRKMGIDINNVCVKLLDDGIVAFEKSFESLLASIEEKVKAVCKN